MKQSAFSAALGICSCMGCALITTDKWGPYNEFMFPDSVFALVSSDSVYVVLTQVPVSLQVKENVPVQMENDLMLGDTLKFVLNVLFGSYSETSNPQKSVRVKQDSIFVWYAHIGPMGEELRKFTGVSSVNVVETIPLPTYYSVQNVLIRKHPRKTVSFHSKLFR